MKRLILVCCALLTLSLAKAQITDITYKVTNYSINGKNYDDLAINSDIALSFYNCDDNTLCFTNHWRKSNSQSYGGVFSLKIRDIEETSTTYAATEIKFTWEFYNTYDSNRGNAAVTITNVFVGNTIVFTAEIIVLNTNEVLIFKGYLE